jgi:hypothetical protein
MRFTRSSGMGLIVLGVLLLGAQLVLSLGVSTGKQITDESRRQSPTRAGESR